MPVSSKHKYGSGNENSIEFTDFECFELRKVHVWHLSNKLCICIAKQGISHSNNAKGIVLRSHFGKVHGKRKVKVVASGLTFQQPP